ncbi:branched-chain amino acid transport system II carrier protein [Sediminibacillus dalangtanensis]|uniref:Branched-chain amino acid transport system carrier protein n=1 Tax=Sediminibacillus dalangtanensis TaxID=2729421 RepID=A0ABX7W1F1_9BACI|nr:branched-chain amino acid transport system II carrier protein [Sediminibacillus dalangtanensis]QTN00948.1 branched-chain amino acid transport system II carrier protein [Sediminibacillus dalangtanensis]
MVKQTFLIGFMLFALFFGAGNLIYPPTLGLEAGTSFWPAMIGFILTGVGLPILAIVAIALIRDQTSELGSKVHPFFGLLFTSVIYLAIGPFFGIPRAANVAFEMGVLPSVQACANRTLILVLFTVVFFGLVYWFSLNPSKLVDRIGQWLTPALLIAVAALCIGSFFVLQSPSSTPSEKYHTAPFFSGFVEGYLTMDAIAALAFGIIVVTAFKDNGIQSKKALVGSTLKAGMISGAALTLVYGSLGWIGAKMAAQGNFDNGGQILSSATQLVFGNFGLLLLGIIVALACFTTSIGLTVACAQYFTKTTRFSYKQIAAMVSIVSFLIANLGLNQIIAISVPVLVAIYPIAIVLVLLTFLNKWFEGSVLVYRGAILLTAVVSVYQGLTEFGLEMNAFQPWIEQLPLFSVGLGWLLPAVIGASIGGFIDHR